MTRNIFLAVSLVVVATACDSGRQSDRDAVEHFHANVKAFEELNKAVSELPDDIRSLKPSSDAGTVQLTRKPLDDDLLTEESTEYPLLHESFANLDLALISRSDRYAVFHRNVVQDGGVEHFFEYISQPVRNESMRCGSHEQSTQSVRSCLVDLDRRWSMWIKTLPAAELRDRAP